MTAQQIFIGLFAMEVVTYIYTKTDLDIIQELSEMVLEIVQLEVKIFIIHLMMIQSAMQHSITQQVAALQMK